MKKLLVLLALSIGSLLHADAVAIGMTAKQRYPWNGKVDIVVTLQGSSNDVSLTRCVFAATNALTQATLKVDHIDRVGDATGAEDVWKKRFVWDFTADVGEVKIDDVALTVETHTEYGVQLWENGPYWAECNVGANKPEEYGYYFMWGDTVGYKRNTSDNGWVSAKYGTSSMFSYGRCPTYDKTTLQSLGYIDVNGNLIAAYDAAMAYLGTPWRMPTESEMRALVSNCTTTWITTNGVYGRLVTGKGDYVSKSIFLPAAGHGNQADFNAVSVGGYYWSSTPCWAGSSTGGSLCFFSNEFSLSYDERYYKNSVRPLRESAQ